MSSSDYTAMQKLRNLYTVNYNTIPSCHTGCHDHASNISYYGVPGQIGHHHTSYPVINTGHPPITSNPHIHQVSHTHGGVEHTHTGVHSHVPASTTAYAADTSCNLYYTTTMRKYYLTPVEGGGITTNVCAGLLFVKGNPIYVSNYDISNNYFKGIISSYNKVTGEISLTNITNIKGTFAGEYTYALSIIFENPEVFELKDQINYLYKYLFNVNLVTNTTYTVPSLELADADKNIFNLYKYLFDLDLRVSDTTYAVTDTYLSTSINNLYTYLFDVNLTTTSITLVTGSTTTDTLTNKINGLVLYLFEVDLATNTTFDPNSS
jgi:hypothetical protein